MEVEANEMLKMAQMNREPKTGQGQTFGDASNWNCGEHVDSLLIIILFFRSAPQSSLSPDFEKKIPPSVS